jgi:hypothetical protein
MAVERSVADELAQEAASARVIIFVTRHYAQGCCCMTTTTTTIIIIISAVQHEQPVEITRRVTCSGIAHHRACDGHTLFAALWRETSG